MQTIPSACLISGNSILSPTWYEQVGWRADKPVFREGYGPDAVYSYTLDAGFDVGFNVREEFDLWVVVKKVMDVSYRAVYEQGGDLMFTSPVSGRATSWKTARLPKTFPKRS